MYNIFKSITVSFTIIVLSACNSGNVKPIQSISDAYVGNMSVQNVTVNYDPEFEERLKRDLDRQTRLLNDKKEYLQRVNSRRIVSSQTKTEATEDLERQQKLYDNAFDNYHNLAKITKDAIFKHFDIGAKNGNKVDLDIKLKKFKLVSDGMIFMGGGSDSMEGEMTIKDANSKNIVGILNVKMQEVNLSGGMVGAMSRTANPKENLINIFTQKIANLIENTD